MATGFSDTQSAPRVLRTSKRNFLALSRYAGRVICSDARQEFRHRKKKLSRPARRRVSSRVSSATRQEPAAWHLSDYINHFLMRANVLKREEIEARVNEKEFMDDYEAELVSGMLSLEGRWRLINVTKNYPSELVASKCETFYPQNVKTANAKRI